MSTTVNNVSLLWLEFRKIILSADQDSRNTLCVPEYSLVSHETVSENYLGRLTHELMLCIE